MANTQHIRANRLTKEANQLIKRVLIFGTPVVAVLCILFPAAWWFFLLVFLIVFLNVFQNVGMIKRAGAKGEDSTLNVLATLPNSYVILNQIELPNPEDKKKFTEIDFIVIGPNGIIIIEVKNNKGRIVGSEEERQWTIYKIGRGGSPYTSTMRNPIKQIKRQIWVLSKFLKEQGHEVWIDGVVYFSNPDSDVEFSGTPSVPIFIVNHGGLTNYILSHRSRHPVKNLDMDKVVHTLISLRK
ncbi:MAG: NERD domain-containing protein [Syntrophales bacterium]|nr:NERD domain-containing protein [Syntrophales bacterium]